MKFVTLAISALLGAVAVSAQATEFACKDTSEILQLIPACARTCDAQGLARTGCPFEDLTCQCSKYSLVKSLVEPCLMTQANCTRTELQAFANVINPMCDYFNGTSNGTYPAPTCSSSSSSAVILPTISTSIVYSTHTSPVVITETYTSLSISYNIPSPIPSSPAGTDPAVPSVPDCSVYPSHSTKTYHAGTGTTWAPSASTGYGGPEFTGAAAAAYGIRGAGGVVAGAAVAFAGMLL
ncbi:hypothetical protein K402DRAFT_463731 [Aulographum hederae CBS 113979]|uniref:CFEM domain-containing protein n=1 Tax=Aulographum hederae CBS 113979 TaxID=1176131 RepID=A0A6G1H069_9PEZI|nr:hypothetical protein K402DRAFT_463731 [Aulographum hederae CBS 113979]